MKVRLGICTAGLALGVIAALIEKTGSIMLALMRPWTALGELLRAWSLSGTAGNIGAWAVVLTLTLLPILFILLLRRKRRQKGDILWVMTSLAAFPTLIFLINPTHLSVAPTSELAELAGISLVMTSLSLLAAAILTRWAGGLKQARLTFWMGALLTLTMALITLATGWALTDSLLLFGETGGSMDPIAQMMGAAQNPVPAIATISLILTLISLIPDVFSLHALNTAASLTETLSKGWFSSETEEQANRLARCARRTLIAVICCAAGKNAASVLLTGMVQGASVGFSVSMDLPLTEMMLSCGAMLLARWLAAACRLKRDNDLMI